MRDKLFAPARDPLWSALAAVAVSLLISFIAIAATGRDPLAGFGNLAAGALAGPGPLGETAIKSAVLILTGLSGESFLYNDPLDSDGPGADRLMTAAQLDAAMNASDQRYAHAAFALAG